MTQHQRHIVTPIDPVKLDRLAEVAVRVGLQLAPGQDLLITAPAVALPLVRRIADLVREGHLHLFAGDTGERIEI